MFHFDYLTENTCSQLISFDLDGETVHNITFTGGCNGNLKTIPILLEGWTVTAINEKLSGITCGKRGTSCADQLAKAVVAAYEASKNPDYVSPLEED